MSVRLASGIWDMHSRKATSSFSAFGSIGDGVRGIWRGRHRHRWLVPLLVFLCATGLLLAVASTVQALAPFLYSIF